MTQDQKSSQSNNPLEFIPKKKQEKDSKSGSELSGLGIRYENACLATFLGTNEEKLSIANWMKNPSKFLIMLGSVGTGKTFFCAALLNYFYETYAQEGIYYLTGRHLASKIREAINAKIEPYGIVQKFASQAMLIVDDIGAGSISDWQKEIILELMDERYNTQKPTVVTSNLDPAQLKEFDFRLHSRLMAKGNLIIQRWENDRRQMDAV